MSERRGSRREPGPIPLLAVILTDRPNLPDAACIGMHSLFDAVLHPEVGQTSIAAQVAAERVCRHCPHTIDCPDSLATRGGVSSTDTSPHALKDQPA